jgi:alpha-glucosidase
MILKRIPFFRLTITTIAIIGISHITFGRDFNLHSPNRRILIKINISEKLLFSATLDKKQIISPSPISLTINKRELGLHPQLLKSREKTTHKTIYPVIRQKSSEILDSHNELILTFKGKFSVIFRAYNDGVAYRFQTSLKDKIIVNGETVTLNFKEDNQIYFPEEESFFSHNERLYIKQAISQIPSTKMCSLPTLVELKDGVKLGITEADLEDYPGLWLRGNLNHSLYGKFPGYVLQEEQTRDRDVKVKKYADYIAKTRGNRQFPWRVIVIAENDGQLITSQLPYLLASPLFSKDTSWIKPGKVAWDWYNFNNIYGVNFKAGLNTETYKYYIDFASLYGIEYVILDEGWYKLGNLFEINPDIDMEGLLAYSQKKNVGIILWVVWKTLEDQFDEALNQFQKWGIKGIKVDFMQRDDQWMVNYYHKVAEEAFKRHMIVDFHGSYKPTGLRRKYPNVLTREGVKGLENCKWSDTQTPEHNVTLPFIRMMAGPMDYTPGAMINAQKENFRSIFKRPMSMGTRCHQLAMYVVYESPLQMLADNPSNYLKEPECMEFLAKVPTVWDKTLVLQAKVGDYIALARQHKNEWYIGAMTDGNQRELTLDFSFLTSGDHTIDIYQDGINAHRYASDYKKLSKTVTNREKMKIKLSKGGGWAAIVHKK